MAKLVNSGVIRIAFDFLVGAALLALTLFVLVDSFDKAVIVLGSIIIVALTGLFIQQDYHMIKSYREERA